MPQLPELIPAILDDVCDFTRQRFRSGSPWRIHSWSIFDARRNQQHGADRAGRKSDREMAKRTRSVFKTPCANFHSHSQKGNYIAYVLMEETNKPTTKMTKSEHVNKVNIFKISSVACGAQCNVGCPFGFGQNFCSSCSLMVFLGSQLRSPLLESILLELKVHIMFFQSAVIRSPTLAMLCESRSLSSRVHFAVTNVGVTQTNCLLDEKLSSIHIL